MALLELDDIHVAYGNIKALRGISLTVERGEIVTLIGGNGAGKTTTLRAVSGVRRLTSGEIRFDGQRIDRLPSHEIVVRGVSQSPEGRRIFPGMSIKENLEMGAYARKSKDLAEAGGTLSGGEQQMLAIGRALMARPTVLLLDEPSMGLAPMMVERIFSIITQINQQGTTVLLIEQNAQKALQTATRGYVIESGEIVLEDRADRLLGNDKVRKAYLGES